MFFSILCTHKEWIFSGIGVTIIVFISKIISKSFKLFMNKIRLNKTSKENFLFAYSLPIYDFYFSENEKSNMPTKSFIENCSIKKHSIVLKKLKKELLDFKSLIWIDIDKFTQVNNLFGKECADAVIDVILKMLFIISKRFECNIYHAKGRDEFYIVISELYLKECAVHFIGLMQQYSWSEIVSDMYITCSVGIARNRTTPIDTIKKARESLNLIKLKGGNGIGPDILKLHPYKLINLHSS